MLSNYLRMKKLLLFFNALVLVLSIFSCSSDDDNDCSQIWKVKEWCEPKVSGIVGCQTPKIKEKRVCDKNIKKGEVRLEYENKDIKEYTEYIEKIK